MFRRREKESRAPGDRAIPRRYKLVALIVGASLIGMLAGTYAAFTASTDNSGNQLDAGTVTVSASDGGTKLFNFSASTPGFLTPACVTIEYTGSLDANVGLFGGPDTNTDTDLQNYITLLVTRGQWTDPANPPAFPSCTGFVADSTDWRGLGAGVLYLDTLANYPTTGPTSLADPNSSSPETWSTGEKHVYHFYPILGSNAAAQGKSLDYVFSWGAINQ